MQIQILGLKYSNINIEVQYSVGKFCKKVDTRKGPYVNVKCKIKLWYEGEYKVVEEIKQLLLVAWETKVPFKLCGKGIA